MTSGNGIAVGVHSDAQSPSEDDWELLTVEQDAEREITRLRDRANEMEDALARAPAVIRKMSRVQARKRGTHF